MGDMAEFRKHANMVLDVTFEAKTVCRTSWGL